MVLMLYLLSYLIWCSHQYFAVCRREHVATRNLINKWPVFQLDLRHGIKSESSSSAWQLLLQSPKDFSWFISLLEIQVTSWMKDIFSWIIWETWRIAESSRLRIVNKICLDKIGCTERRARGTIGKKVARPGKLFPIDCFRLPSYKWTVHSGIITTD